MNKEKKTAKEMFEELGYKQYKSDISIAYDLSDYTCIRFSLKRKEFIKNSIYPITMSEFKAIHQQLKELGWLDE